MNQSISMPKYEWINFRESISVILINVFYVTEWVEMWYDVCVWNVKSFIESFKLQVEFERIHIFIHKSRKQASNKWSKQKIFDLWCMEKKQKKQPTNQAFFLFFLGMKKKWKNNEEIFLPVKNELKNFVFFMYRTQFIH